MKFARDILFAFVSISVMIWMVSNLGAFPSLAFSVLLLVVMWSLALFFTAMVLDIVRLSHSVRYLNETLAAMDGVEDGEDSLRAAYHVDMKYYHSWNTRTRSRARESADSLVEFFKTLETEFNHWTPNIPPKLVLLDDESTIVH